MNSVAYFLSLRIRRSARCVARIILRDQLGPLGKSIALVVVSPPCTAR